MPLPLLLLLLLLHTSPRATPAFFFVDTDHKNSLQPSPPPSNSSPLTFKWPASSSHNHTLTTDLHSNSAGCAPMYVSYVMSMVMMFIFRLWMMVAAQPILPSFPLKPMFSYLSLSYTQAQLSPRRLLYLSNLITTPNVGLKCASKRHVAITP